MRQIQGCEETDEVDVDDWLSAKCKGNQKFSGHEIVSLFTHDSNEEVCTIYDIDDTQRCISHFEGGNALEAAI